MKMIFLTLSILTLVILTGCSNVQNNENYNVGIPESETSVAIESSTTKKTHTSDKFSLSFDYPDNWTVYEDTMQIDVQPPSPARWSNYFTIEILDREYSPYKSLEDRIAARDLKKADFTIDGKDVYVDKNLDSADELELVYLLFSHQDKVHQLYMFKSWYDLSAVQAMIKSLRLN